MRLFKRKEKKIGLNRAEALRCIPVKNIQVIEVRIETGEVLLSYPLHVRPWIAGLSRRFGVRSDSYPTKKLQMDVLGTAVWDLVDGNRSVLKIIREFAEKYQLHPKEAEVSVTQFFRELGKRGIIGLNPSPVD
ncbi:MAG: PqqD family peptide modification chaperone [Desulfobacterales bacterium]|nr:PqqD family peptide modification chaperone [Desulfobacterales bacterium]